MRGFVLIELLIVVFIITVLAGLTVAGFSFFRQQINLNDTAEQIISALNSARNRTIASLNESSYGVHFANNQYVLFSGVAYNPANPGNEMHNLPVNIEIFAINLTGGSQEAIFDRLTGRTSQSGQISLRIISDPLKIKNVYIESSGQISLNSSVFSSDTRIKDSRHIHFGYNRLIDINSEKIILTFSDPLTIQEIIIKDNLNAGGQLSWQGLVGVGGQNQQIEVKTHQLNNPLTIFSINRDRRYNTKPLIVSLSGDASYTLIDYAADGTTTPGSSVWASAPQPQ